MRRLLLVALLLAGCGVRYVGSPSALHPPYTAAWTRSLSSPVLSPSQTWEETAVSEVAGVIFDGTWRMWYTGGWTHPGLGYATSSDGLTWTHYVSNPVYGQGGSGYANTSASSRVLTVGSTLYLYTSGGSSTTDVRSTFKVATGTDGISWTTQSSSISLASGCTLWGNRAVWIEGATWYMLQEELTSGSFWATYYYTSSDGLTWSIGNGGTALTSLQVIAGGMYGGPRFAMINGVLVPKPDGTNYELWYHATAVAGNLPTNIYHATSTDRITWTISPATPVLTHTGTGFEVDQVAGPVPLVVGTTAYLFYDGDDNTASAAKIGLATATAIP